MGSPAVASWGQSKRGQSLPGPATHLDPNAPPECQRGGRATSPAPRRYVEVEPDLEAKSQAGERLLGLPERQ